MPSTYTYHGPTVRIPHPETGVLTRLAPGGEYQFQEGSLPGLMDGARPVGSGKLVMNAAPVAKKATPSPEPAPLPTAKKSPLKPALLPDEK